MLVGGDIHTAVTLDEVHTLVNNDRDEMLVIFGPGVPLSEAVSFAAGHRPCAECRRDSYNAYRRAWAEGLEVGVPQAQLAPASGSCLRRPGPHARR